ncbi:sensor histidine kinase [Amorphoplanes digitatis]|uniref:histidine kinase n=1 Tax=Actinoplanes digitatis TaxID=1868 RepID=A0A7W7HUT8_9ACTN|nr:sensor histidine kinase [Actinoplanes digitatis]MBB4761140.1 signal transduction histidine kinase [Actinoplanes digitatis]GID92756.1 histidine kinase [Actinoplanes digitatis]
MSTNEEPWQARYLLTAGPWRALAYVITTCPFAALTGMAVGTLILPWLVAVLRLHDGRMLEGPLLFLMVTALALFAGLGPLVAIPLAAVERGRLALVDRRPVRSGHRAAEPNPVSWLRLRYTEAATWREVLYAVILGLVVPVVYGVYALLALIDVACVVSPLFAATGTDSWQFGVFTVNSTAEAIPLSIFGLLFVPVLAHLLGLISAGQAATARALLGDRDGAALREVAQSRARLADAFEAERRRIERDLHDGAQHRLTSLTLQIGMARLDVPEDSPAAAPLARAHDEAKELMVVLRDLIHGIRPQSLADLGLPAALRELGGRSPLPVTVTVADGMTRPAPHVEGCAYFVASEALANVVRHSGANRADLLLAQTAGMLVLEVRDDGHGGADPAGGTGLTGLADRVAAVGGRVLLASPEGGPTLIRAELPCRS